MITNKQSKLRVDIFKVRMVSTEATNSLTEDHTNLTPSQSEVLAYLDGFNLNYIANSEFAYLNFRPHLKEIYAHAKKICSRQFSPNPQWTLRECLTGFVALLWEKSEDFAGLPEDGRQAYALQLLTRAANRAIRRPRETQLPGYTSDLDVSVPSCTRNPMDPDPKSDNYGQRVYNSKPEGLSHIQGRPDWVNANQYENNLIAAIDGSRAAVPDSESEFEKCERILGSDDADWYWSVKANRDLFPQRHPARRVLTAAERKRYERLKRVLDAGSRLRAYRGGHFIEKENEARNGTSNT